MKGVVYTHTTVNKTRCQEGRRASRLKAGGCCYVLQVVWCERLSANHGNEAGMNVLSEGRGLGAWRMTKWARAFVAARGCAATSRIHTSTRIPSLPD